jgi:hypothetical protein
VRSSGEEEGTEGAKFTFFTLLRFARIISIPALFVTFYYRYSNKYSSYSEVPLGLAYHREAKFFTS